MVVDTFTIAICVALLLLAVVSAVLLNPLRRRPADDYNSTAGTDGLPPLSVIIPVRDNADEIRRNLPTILSQDYAPGFEVIVVDESSTDETVDVLKRLQADYPQLYITFIPESSHYVSRRKLSITLGVKAAKNEWLLFTTADCCPQSDRWLASIGSRCTDERNLVLGYTKYRSGCTSFQRFYRMLAQCIQMRQAERATSYAYCGRNLALRRSCFMENNGFQANLKYLRGEYDFLVNEYSVRDGTGVAFDEYATLLQDTPTRKEWTNDRLYYIETNKHLRHGFVYHLRDNADTLFLHANFLLQVCAVVTAALLQQWITLATAIVCVILTLTLRIAIAAKAMRLFNERLPLSLVPLLELTVAWRRVAWRIKYRRSDKYDFIRR